MQQVDDCGRAGRHLERPRLDISESQSREGELFTLNKTTNLVCFKTHPHAFREELRAISLPHFPYHAEVLPIHLVEVHRLQSLFSGEVVGSNASKGADLCFNLL